MEHLNQQHNYESDTIPGVGLVEDVSIGVWDGLGNNLGSLSMDFDLPNALSPEGVETTVTAATVESFGGDSDTEVIVAPELIAEINEIGRRVLAGYKILETDEASPAEELDLAEPVVAEEPTNNEIEPIIYAKSQARSSQTIAYPEISPIDDSTEDAKNISSPTGTHAIDLFVELALSASPDSLVVTPESLASSESDSRHDTELPPYLGSLSLTEPINLVLIDEQLSAGQSDVRPQTIEAVLAAEAAVTRTPNQTPETLIYAGSGRRGLLSHNEELETAVIHPDVDS